MNEIRITPASSQTSSITPITLSETQRVQMTFECTQVNNLKDLSKNLKGKLVIKKKNKDIESFDDIPKFGKKDIRSNELVEIALDTEETYNLAQGLSDYYRLVSGTTTDPFNENIYVKRDDKIRMLEEIVADRDELISVLGEIDLSTLNTAIHIESLKRVKTVMEDNLHNDHEVSFWQPFFEEHSWILSQLFHAPFIFFNGKRYLGGKGIDNSGGQYTDFIFQNELTKNVAVVEIKSPVKKLIGKQYRQAYSLSEELSGGINQLLKQRAVLTKEYASLYERASKSGEAFNVDNIECILVIGTVGSLSPEEKELFDTYRNDHRTLRIITFDELLNRVTNLLSLFESVN